MTGAAQESRSSRKGEEFDDVLYGSELSESEGDEDDVEMEETAPKNRRAGKGAKNQTGNKLRVDDDQPMDLLEGVGMRLEGEAPNGLFMSKPYPIRLNGILIIYSA